MSGAAAGTEFREVTIKNGPKAGKVIRIPIRKPKAPAAVEPNVAPGRLVKPAAVVEREASGPSVLLVAGAVGVGLLVAIVAALAVRRSFGSAPAGDAEVIEFPGGRVS